MCVCVCVCHCVQGGSDAKAGSSTPSQQVAKTLAASLKALAARIESEPDVYLLPALDVMETEFMKKRLPPHPEQLKDKGECDTHTYTHTHTHTHTRDP